MKTKKLYFIISAITIAAIVVACKGHRLYKGDRNYNNLNYAKSIPYYEKLYKKTEDEAVGMKLAEAYYRTGQMDKAEMMYKKVAYWSESGSEGVTAYAKVLMSNDKHYKAIKVLNEHLAYNKDDKEAQRLLRACYEQPKRYRDTTLYTLEPLDIGGVTNAFSATPFGNGIIFIGDSEVGKRKQYGWTGNSYLDAYVMSYDEEGNWREPTLLSKEINGKFHEGPLTFTQDKKTVYFSRNNYTKKKLEADSTQTNHLKIFSAQLVEDEWTEVQEISINSDNYSVSHPAISADEQTLFFASDMPGGFGGTDLYRVHKTEEGWSEPENLGASINTKGNELFPFVSASGLLFFSSDSHNSMGGLDVFTAEETDGVYSTPENLNYPVNSNLDDFGFSIDETTKKGYVSSSRSGQDKIYEFEQHAPTFRLLAFVHEKGNETPMEGIKVEITVEETGEVIPFVSNEDGEFQFKLEPGQTYYLNCLKIGCETASKTISTKGLKYSKDFIADFSIDLDILYKSFVLENIYYDYDKWDIRPESGEELKKLAHILEENPKVSIEMGSHTDSRGGDDYNMRLSDKRAEAAVEYLIRLGIDPKRLSYKGYGESVPRNKCTNGVVCNEDQHQENRRTEFKVVGIEE